MPDRIAANKKYVVRLSAAWNAERNARHAKVHWRFTTADARIKLERLYPRF